MHHFVTEMCSCMVTEWSIVGQLSNEFSALWDGSYNNGLIYGQVNNPWLTHWGRVTHICVSDLTSIASDNGLSPGRRQAIIRTNAGILLIRPLGTNFSEFLVEILIFSFKKMRFKVLSAKRGPFCVGFNECYKNAERVWLLNNKILQKMIKSG